MLLHSLLPSSLSTFFILLSSIVAHAMPLQNPSINYKPRKNIYNEKTNERTLSTSRIISCGNAMTPTNAYAANKHKETKRTQRKQEARSIGSSPQFMWKSMLRVSMASCSRRLLRGPILLQELRKYARFPPYSTTRTR
jgi:hypothetical protein